MLDLIKIRALGYNPRIRQLCIIGLNLFSLFLLAGGRLGLGATVGLHTILGHRLLFSGASSRILVDLASLLVLVEDRLRRRIVNP